MDDLERVLLELDYQMRVNKTLTYWEITCPQTKIICLNIVGKNGLETKRYFYAGVEQPEFK